MFIPYLLPVNKTSRVVGCVGVRPFARVLDGKRCAHDLLLVLGRDAESIGWMPLFKVKSSTFASPQWVVVFNNTAFNSRFWVST